MGYFNRKNIFSAGDRLLMLALYEAIEAGRIPRALLHALDPLVQEVVRRGRQPPPAPEGAYELNEPDLFYCWLAGRPERSSFDMVTVHVLLQQNDDDESFQSVRYGRNGPYLQATAYSVVAARLLQKASGDEITVLTCESPFDANYAWIVDFADDDDGQ